VAANTDQHNPVMVDQYIPLMAQTGGSQASLPEIYCPPQLRTGYFDFGKIPFFSSSSGVAVVATVVSDVGEGSGEGGDGDQDESKY